MSVFNRIQRPALAALCIVLIVVGALIALPYFISAHEVRAAVSRSLKAATGAEPQISGDVRLTILPVPTIRLDEVRLDHRTRPGLNAGSLHASVQILPLLIGRVQIDSLTLEEPRLRLELGPDGAYLAGLPLRAPAASNASAPPEIRIRGGTLEVSIADAERFERLATLEASLAWSDQSLSVSGKFVWRGVTTSIDLLVNDTVALGRGARSPLRLRLEAEPLRVGFDGGLAFRNGIQANGALTAESKSLRDTLSWLAVSPPTRGGFGKFRLKAQAALTPAGLALSGLSVDLDGNRAEGGLTWKRENGRPLIQSTLASESADVTAYASGFAVTGENGRDWSREPINLEALDHFDLDLRLSAARILLRGAELSNAAVAATLKGGRFTLSVGEAQFYGGRLRGTASLGPGEAGPEMKVEANLTDFDLQRGLVGLFGIRQLEGKGQLALALQGNGPHVHAITRSLSGQATLTGSRGALNGINVEEVLKRFERTPLSAVADFRGGRTTFDQLIARLRINRGKARLEAAQVDNASVRVTLGGETSISDRDLDLKGTASLLRSGSTPAAALPFDLPFVVQGTWDRPFLLPDPVALIHRSDAAAPLLDLVPRRATADERPGIQDTTGVTSAKEALPPSDAADSQGNP